MSVIEETLLPPVGVWTATLYDGDKEWNDCGRLITPVLWTKRGKNLITTVGKQLILDRLIPGNAAVAPTGIAVGTSGTAAAVGDTAITNAVFKAFAVTPTRVGLTTTYQTSFATTEANINIQEAGMLTAAGGILFNRIAPYLSFTKQNVTALDITVTLNQA